VRVCPKCKYRDLLIWHNAWHKRFTDVTNIDSLQEWDDELAQKILDSPKLYFDGLYNYHLSKRGYVVRILREHAVSPSSVEEPHRELWKPAFHRHVNQSRLFDCAKNEKASKNEVKG